MTDEPQSYRIILASGVSTDLDGIFEYIAQDSPQNASHLIAEILSTLESLKRFPLRNVVHGQERRGIELRSLPVGDYMIFFRADIKKRTVTVVNVRHGARRRPKRFK